MPDPAAVYQERHSALSWPLLALGLFGPLALAAACLILAIAVSPVWLLGIAFLVLFAPVQAQISLLYRNWPTGIRLDESTISIGAVGSPRAAGRVPTVIHQSWGLFTCPRAAVTGARVVTGRAAVRDLRTAPQYATLTSRWTAPRRLTRCHLGVLTGPFMRAALVVDVDLGVITAPDARPSRMFSNGMNGYFSRLIEPELSPVWVVPTRHPDAVRRALTEWLPTAHP
jgi:hypothetical protein